MHARADGAVGLIVNKAVSKAIASSNDSDERRARRGKGDEIEQQFTPLAVSVRVAARITCLSPRTMWATIRSGKLDVVRVTGRTLIKYTSLQKFMEGEKTPLK